MGCEHHLDAHVWVSQVHVQEKQSFELIKQYGGIPPWPVSFHLTLMEIKMEGSDKW